MERGYKSDVICPLGNMIEDTKEAHVFDYRAFSRPLGASKQFMLSHKNVLHLLQVLAFLVPFLLVNGNESPIQSVLKFSRVQCVWNIVKCSGNSALFIALEWIYGCNNHLFGLYMTYRRLRLLTCVVV